MTPNLNYIKKLADGSEAFEQKMFGILKTEFPQEKQAFLNYYKAKDYNASAELVHKLKHKFGMLGMTKAYDFSISFESDLKKDKVTAYLDFIAILEVVETFIQKL